MYLKGGLIMTAYRPTIRYPEMTKNFIEGIFQATELDRNQIIKLALHVAAHSQEFKVILRKHQNADVPLPSPGWRRDDHDFWKDPNYVAKPFSPEPEVQSKVKLINTGGIKLILK